MREFRYVDKRPGTRWRKPKKWDGEFEFEFSNVQFACSLSPVMYESEDAADAMAVLDALGDEGFSVDKTFVRFKGTRFEKTFMREDGWNALRELVSETRENRTPAREVIYDMAFRKIMVGYAYMMFQEMGWDTSGIELSVKSGDYDVECRPDTYEEWKRYPGKWQTWGK